MALTLERFYTFIDFFPCSSFYTHRMHLYGKCGNYAHRTPQYCEILNNWTRLWEALHRWLLPIIYVKSMASREFFMPPLAKCSPTFVLLNRLHLWLLINFVLFGRREGGGLFVYFSGSSATFMWSLQLYYHYGNNRIWLAKSYHVLCVLTYFDKRKCYWSGEAEWKRTQQIEAKNKMRHIELPLNSKVTHFLLNAKLSWFYCRFYNLF